MRLKRFLFHLAMSTVLSLATACVTLVSCQVVANVKHSREVERKTIKVWSMDDEAVRAASEKDAVDEWCTIREGDVLWVVCHGSEDGFLWFKRDHTGNESTVHPMRLAGFLRGEGVDLAGVKTIIVHSCFNGRWNEMEDEDGIVIRPSQTEHGGTVCVWRSDTHYRLCK